MTQTYLDILNTLCSEVSVINENDAEIVHKLNNEKEAKLAYDVMVAYGFDVKLYREDASSKFYISRLDLKSAAQQRKIPGAIAHASALKNILHTVTTDAGARNFNINFLNTSSQGKQITIFFPPDSYEMANQPTPVAKSVSASAQPAPQVPKPAMAASNKPASLQKKVVKEKTGVMADEPGLAKKYPFGIRGAGITETGDLTTKKRMTSYVYSNLTASIYAFVIMITLVSLVLTVFITSKGWFCLDFAQVKNRNPPWYCTFMAPPEDPKKAKTDLDLIPVPPQP